MNSKVVLVRYPVSSGGSAELPDGFGIGDTYGKNKWEKAIPEQEE